MATLTDAQAAKVYDAPFDDDVLRGIIERRSSAAKTYENKAQLDEVRKKNNDLYLSKYAQNQNPEKAIFADNRLFVAIRSITPYITSRLTQPEITPADGTDLGLQFAQDFERIIVQLAEDTDGKYKLRLAAQDLLKGARIGWLKWQCNADGELELRHIVPSKIRCDGDTDMFTEPNFLQEDLELSVADILDRFPHKRATLMQLFGLDIKNEKTDAWYETLEEVKTVTENWTFIADGKGDKSLVCAWECEDTILGAMADGLYKKDAKNIISKPMMPYMWFNFLNDGEGKLDSTSFIEQATPSQRNYERLGQAITDTTTFGVSGVPVFAKDAMDATEVPKVKFQPNKRIVLDLKKSGATRINDAFTTWKADAVQAHVVEDKYDSRNNVDNTFGTPSIFRGEKTDANTLGQDVMLRDQAEGRLQDPVDCIDKGMQRFFLLEAQFIFRYFGDEDYYRFLGEDGNFEQVMLTNEKVAKNAGMTIRVKAGTNLPVDRSQRIAMTMELLKLNKAPTLESYKILGLYDDPDKAYKQFLMEQVDPASAMAEVDKAMFNREAMEDLYTVIGGKVPDEQEDLKPEYVQYLVDWLNTDKFRGLSPGQQQAVSEFAQMIQAKAQLKLAKLESMQPSPQDQVGPDGQPIAPGQDPSAPQAGGPPQGPPPPPPPEPDGLSLPPSANIAASGLV